MADSDPNGTEDQQFSASWRKPRACARCHRLKMRCYYTDPSHKNCSRCFLIGVPCLLDEDPTAKFARKNKSSKGGNAELKKLQQLTESVNETVNLILAREYGNDDDLTPRPEARGRLNSVIKNLTLLESLRESQRNLQYAINKTIQLLGEFDAYGDANDGADVQKWYPKIPYWQNIAKELMFTYELLNVKVARARFQFFILEMIPYYPIVSFSHNLRQFDYLLEKHPMLLISCIAVTCIHENDFLTTAGPISEDDKLIRDNEGLQDILYYYLDKYLLYRIYCQLDQFLSHLIEICIVLLTWLPPPNRLGHYKNLMNVLVGLNVLLCLGLGQRHMYSEQTQAANRGSKIDDLLDETNDIRAFLSVYCTCALLGLSLLRFKVIASWLRDHFVAVNVLSKLTRSDDKFLVLYARFLKLAQEIHNALDLDDPNIRSDIGGSNMSSSSSSSSSFHTLFVSLPSDKLLFLARNYEEQLSQVLLNSEFMDSGVPQGYMLHMTYYHVLLAIYDKTLAVQLAERQNQLTSNSLAQENRFIDPFLLTRIVTCCEKLLDQYIQLTFKTFNYPTFVYYRPMHTLVLLIRMRLLMKTHTELEGTAQVRVEYYFDKIKSNFINNKSLYQADMFSSMKEILNKVQKWIRVSEEYTSSPSAGPLKDKRSSILINMMNRRKHEEIEALEVPDDVNDRKRVKKVVPESHLAPRNDGDGVDGILIDQPIPPVVNGSFQASGVDRNTNSTTDTLSFTPAVSVAYAVPGRLPVPPAALAASVGQPAANFMDQVGMERLFQEIDLDMLKYLNGSYDPMFATTSDASATFFPNWTGNVPDPQFS